MISHSSSYAELASRIDSSLGQVDLPTLFIILGPTGVGKSALAEQLSQLWQVPIISVDSRQIFSGMRIGTAAPDAATLERIPHHFIGTLTPDTHYSASRYEQEALALLEQHFRHHPRGLVVGGSMMYLDALAHGIDAMPDPTPELRETLWQRWKDEGLENLRQELRELDPEYLSRIDPNNHKRIIRALEVCLTTGHCFSSFHTHTQRKRPFRIIKIGVSRRRDELYRRINQRTKLMLQKGLIEEVRRLLPYRHYNALNTVGYKEVFRHLDGDLTLEETEALIAKNTRQYARKQLSWFRRDPDILWFDITDTK